METKLNGIKVAIVDDDAEVVISLANFLREQGCEVYECERNKKIRGIKDFGPDVILMDEMLEKNFRTRYGRDLAYKLKFPFTHIIGISILNDSNYAYAFSWTEKHSKQYYSDLIPMIAKIVGR